jgi:hypothetical protein
MQQLPVGDGHHHPGEGWSDRREAEMVSRRLERLSPLLRDLITWDLVYRSESGTFLLREDVQQWLEGAVARHARSTAPEVYVGRPCQRCGASGLTRMVDGVRVCASCSQVAVVNEVVRAESKASGWRRHGHHDGRSWWTHKAG